MKKGYKNYLNNVVTECFNNHLSSLEWDKNDPTQLAMYLRLHDASKQLLLKLKRGAINISHCKIDANTEIDEESFTFCNNYKSRVLCKGCNFNLYETNSSEIPNSSFYCNDEKHYPEIGRCNAECEMCKNEKLKNATKR